MALKRKAQKLVITLDNVKQSDAIALIKMFRYMQLLGSIGSSRMCSFYADGDGDFHPKFSYEYPEALPEVPEINGIVTWNKPEKRLEGTHAPHQDDFVIDPDSIAWQIYHDPEPEDYVRQPNHSADAIKLKK